MGLRRLRLVVSGERLQHVRSAKILKFRSHVESVGFNTEASETS